jgi:predicted esterase
MSERRFVIIAVLISVFFSVSTSTPAADTSDRIEDWVERLKGLEGHKAAAFNVGPELVRLEPDFGLKVVAATWPKLTDIEVKRGLLKAFHFGKHTKIIKVLHLGVTDSEKKVRETALNYLSEYSMPMFSGNTRAYQRWYAEFSDKSLEEIREAGLKRNRPILKKKLQEIVSALKAGNRRQLRVIAHEVAKFKDPLAIPTLIGIIDADNSSDTIYGVGHFSLGEITGVQYSPYHDGAWWRRWWEKNKTSYPEEVQNIAIPELAKTKSGKVYKPYPEELDNLEGKIQWLLKEFSEGHNSELDLNNIAKEIAKENNPRAIPIMIGVIDADNSLDTIYKVGYYGLGKITGVQYSPYHDGAWWRRWWEKNKSLYPEEVQSIAIPELAKTKSGKAHKPYPEELDNLEGKIKWLLKEFSEGHISNLGLSDIAREIAKENDPRAIPIMIGVIDADNTRDTIYGIGYFGLGKITRVRYSNEHNGAWWRQWWEKNKGRYPKYIREMEIPNLRKKAGHGAPSIELPALGQDIADIASKELHAGGDLNKRYFLIGAGKDDKPPKEGYNLIVIMPGGGGGDKFHPFVRRIYKNALGDKFLVAQPVAFKWHASQKIVWPTKVNPTDSQKFATEDFIEAVIQDVKKHYKINNRNIFTLSWSSSGPAAYAISLQKSTQVKGSFIAMSVFRRNWLPPLDTAKGHIYYLLHSPEDTICPFSHAEQAKVELAEAGAIVQLDTYKGGHGWYGDVYGNIQRGITWLTAKMNQEKPPSKR